MTAKAWSVKKNPIENPQNYPQTHRSEMWRNGLKRNVPAKHHGKMFQSSLNDRQTLAPHSAQSQMSNAAFIESRSYPPFDYDTAFAFLASRI